MSSSTVTESKYHDQSGNEQTQFKTTVPKSLAEAMDMGGKKLEWSVKSQNTLEVRIVDDD